MVTYVYRHGSLVDKRHAAPRHSGRVSGVISDEMDATRNMADGRYYTSKSKFRAATKAAGCIEVGNDPAILRPRKPVPLDPQRRREDIQRTIYDLRNRK